MSTTLEATPVTALKFNTSTPQVYRDRWRGTDRVCRYTGKCVLCGRRTYGFDDGEDDPRGPLGDHSAQPLDPADYGCTGEELPCCFPCQNDSEERYDRAVARARKRGHWVEKPAAAKGGAS